MEDDRSQMVTTYADILLEGWEDVYRKSQLSLLILLALKDHPKYTAQIAEFMWHASNGLQKTDDQSLYRTLRRFTQSRMISYQEIPSKNGPKRKLYELTEIGQEVLERFLERNVINFFYNPHIRKILGRN